MKRIMSVLLALLMMLAAGGALAAERDFKFNSYSYDGLLYLEGYTGNERSVTIPGWSGYGNQPLYGIEDGAFTDNERVESVRIPEGVRNIERSAFRNCTSLRIVYIPATVTAIHTRAFRGSEYVTVITPKGSYAAQFAQENGMSVWYEGAVVTQAISSVSSTTMLLWRSRSIRAARNRR